MGRWEVLLLKGDGGDGGVESSPAKSPAYSICLRVRLGVQRLRRGAGAGMCVSCKTFRLGRNGRLKSGTINRAGGAGPPAGAVSGSPLFWVVPWVRRRQVWTDAISSAAVCQVPPFPLPPSSPSPVASAFVVHSYLPKKCRDESFRRPTLLLAPRLRHKGRLLRVGTIPPVRERTTPTRTTTPSKKKRAKMKTFLPMYHPPPPTNKPVFRPQFSSPLRAHSMIQQSCDM